MARNSRHALPPSSGPESSSANTPRSLTKQEFGRRLYRRMIEKNWNQSDLARHAFGTDKAGNVKGRDAISTYIRGIAFPEPKSLKKLADAFGCEPHELLPNAIEAAMDSEVPALEIKQASGHPDKVWIRVNQMVPLDVAAKIFDALKTIATDASKK